MRICAPCACVCVCVCVCCQYNLQRLALWLWFLVAPSTLITQDHKFRCNFRRETGLRRQYRDRVGGGELSPMWAAENSRWNEGEGTSSVRRGMYHYVSISSGNVLNQDHTQSKCHIILEHLINMSLKDLQEELLYACKLREWGGLW